MPLITNILNGRILLYSLPLAIGINVPVGVTTYYCLLTVDAGHVPRNSTSHYPNSYYRTAPTRRFMRALRFIDREFPFDCLKVDNIPRRLLSQGTSYQLFTIQLRDDGERRTQTLATVIGEQRYSSDYGVARAVLLYF